MNTVPKTAIVTDTVLALLGAAAEVAAQYERSLRQSADTDQLALPLYTGADQACEDFMGEREQLQEKLNQAEHIMRHVAGFNNELQRRLNSIGISFQAAGQTGEPVLVIDPSVLQPALTDMLQG